MTKDEFMDLVGADYVDEHEKAQLSQEDATNDATSGTISRQAAIDALHMHLMYRMGTDSNKKRLDDWINGVPSAQPEQKKGKWKVVGKDMYINLENAREQYRDLGYPHRNELKLRCSECGMLTIVDESIAYNYCPHCGAKMEGETK